MRFFRLFQTKNTNYRFLRAFFLLTIQVRITGEPFKPGGGKILDPGLSPSGVLTAGKSLLSGNRRHPARIKPALLLRTESKRMHRTLFDPFRHTGSKKQQQYRQYHIYYNTHTPESFCLKSEFRLDDAEIIIFIIPFPVL